MNAPHEEAVEFAKVSKRENRVYVGNLSYDVKYRDLMEFMRGGGLGDSELQLPFASFGEVLGMDTGLVMVQGIGDRGDVIAVVARELGQVKVEAEDADDAEAPGYARLGEHTTRSARATLEAKSDGSWSWAWVWSSGRGGIGHGDRSGWHVRGGPRMHRFATQSPSQPPAPTSSAELEFLVP